MKLLLLIVFTVPLLAQTQTKVSPDCSIPGTFTGTGSSGVFDNRPASSNTGIPCSFWSLTYSAAPGVTATTTIAIEAAPDNNGVPGSFAALASSSTLPSAKLDTAGTNGYYP